MNNNACSRKFNSPNCVIKYTLLGRLCKRKRVCGINNIKRYTIFHSYSSQIPQNSFLLLDASIYIDTALRSLPRLAFNVVVIVPCAICAQDDKEHVGLNIRGSYGSWSQVNSEKFLRNTVNVWTVIFSTTLECSWMLHCEDSWCLSLSFMDIKQYPRTN